MTTSISSLLPGLRASAAPSYELNDTQKQIINSFDTSSSKLPPELQPEDCEAYFRRFEENFTRMGLWAYLKDLFLDGSNGKQALNAIAYERIASAPGGLEYLARKGEGGGVESGRYLMANTVPDVRDTLLQNVVVDPKSGMLVARHPELCMVLSPQLISGSGAGALTEDQVRMVLTSPSPNLKKTSLLQRLANSDAPLTLRQAEAVTALLGKFTPVSHAEKELTAKVYAKTAETYGDVPEQKFHEMVQASDKQIDLYQDLGKIGSREHLYALEIKAIALEEGAKVFNGMSQTFMSQRKIANDYLKQADAVRLQIAKVQEFAKTLDNATVDELRGWLDNPHHSEVVAQHIVATMRKEWGDLMFNPTEAALSYARDNPDEWKIYCDTYPGINRGMILGNINDMGADESWELSRFYLTNHDHQTETLLKMTDLYLDNKVIKEFGKESGKVWYYLIMLTGIAQIIKENDSSGLAPRN